MKDTMAPNNKNESRHNSLSTRYGILLSSISLVSIFSILEFYGKLQVYGNLKENYHFKDVKTSNATSTTTSAAIIGNAGTKKRHGEPNERDYGLNPHGQKSTQLEVAWLMSFPNSGTTYTNHLIQSYTETTTATNYGHEQDTKNDSISIFPDSIEGPFFRYPSWLFPPRYILTKTHCGGECDTCQTPGNKKYINSVDAYERACCTGRRISNSTKIRTIYSSDVPKRAVHLIRDPFDNIVARLNYKQRHWARHNNEKYRQRVALFNKTREGFKAYCEFRDLRSFQQEVRARFLSHEVLECAKDVPCFQEFISYTRWHDHAIQLLAKKSIPAMTLFYEDYALDWDTTVKQLLEFLSLTPANGAQAEMFILGKHYNEFYDEKEKLAAKKLMQELASTELWDLLQRYFP